MIYGAIWQGCVASCAEARRALKHTHTCEHHTRKSFKLKARTRYPPSHSLSLCLLLSRSGVHSSFGSTHTKRSFCVPTHAWCPKRGMPTKWSCKEAHRHCLRVCMCVCVELQEQMPQPIAADSKSKAMPHLGRGASTTSAPPGCQPQWECGSCSLACSMQLGKGYANCCRQLQLVVAAATAVAVAFVICSSATSTS